MENEQNTTENTQEEVIPQETSTEDVTPETPTEESPELVAEVPEVAEEEVAPIV